ncbi:MAG: O-antigen ligase family protein [Capsulimonadaceae bacterium]|nr:O-antigen ligase family protein [Capsulimonadaceae bacterium]
MNSAAPETEVRPSTDIRPQSALSSDGVLLAGWTAFIGLLVAGQERMGPLASGDLAIAILLAAFAACLFARRGRWTRTALDPIVGLWTILSLGWCALGLHRQSLSPNPYDFMLYGGGPYGPIHLLAVQIGASAAYYLAVWTIDATRHGDASAAPLTASLEIASAITLFLCISEPIRLHNPSARIEAGFTNANLLGSFLVLMIPAVLAQLLLSPTNTATRAVRGCLVAALLGALMMTRSRGAESGMAIGLVVIVVAWASRIHAGKRLRRSVLATCAVLACVALGYLATSHHGLGDYLDHSRSDGQRRIAWRAGCMLIARNPLTGVGLGAFPAAMVGLGLREPNPFTRSGLPEISARHVHAHNVALQAGAERGIAGIALLAAAGVVLLRRALRLFRDASLCPAAIGGAAAIAAWTVQNMADYTAWLPAIAIVLAIQIAVVMHGDRSRAILKSERS